MIVEWFIGVMTSALQALINALPKIDPPSWLTTAGAAVQGVLDKVGALGYWIPFSLAFTVAASVMVILLAGFAIKVLRIAVSLLSAGGGSAG